MADVRYGHPQFGQLIKCACAQDRDRQRAALARSGAAAALAERLGILQGCTLDNFDLARPVETITWDDVLYASPAQVAALAAAVAAARSYAATPRGWLYLYGAPGSGKSHLAAAIGQLRVQAGDTVLYGSTPQILATIKAGFGRGDESDVTVRTLCTVNLLVLDDLGAEQRTAWSETTLYHILNERYLARLPTVITSNEAPEALELRIADRICGLARIICLPVSSYRRLVQARRA